jgi:hypothetical protein
MKRLKLPERWWRRWDNRSIGTLQWWIEYAAWKTTKLCYHGNYFKLDDVPSRRWHRRWDRNNESCRMGWLAERESLDPRVWANAVPVEIIARPKTQEERDEIMARNFELDMKLGQAAVPAPVEEDEE